MAEGETLPVTTEGVIAGAGGGGEFPPAASVAPASGPALVNKADDNAPESFDDSFVKKDQLTEKRPQRRLDPIDEAVGSSFWVLNGSEGSWTVKPKKGSQIKMPNGTISRTAHPFTATRWYIHKRIAIDFPLTDTEADFFLLKREVLRKLGVTAVCVPPRDALSGPELRDAISAESLNVIRKTEKKKGGISK
jgi:hypothetical protein